MTFPVVRSKITSQDSGTSHVISLPSGIVDGDLLLAFYHSTADSTSVWPAGWIFVASRQQGGSGMQTEIRYRDADGTEGSTITVTSPAPEGATGHAVYRIDTHDPANPPEATLADGSTVSPNPPSLTPTGGVLDYLWIAAMTINGLGSITARPGSYTDALDRTYGGGEMSSMQRELNAASENPSTYTVATSSQPWVASTVAVFPAPPPPAGVVGSVNLDSGGIFRRSRAVAY